MVKNNMINEHTRLHPNHVPKKKKKSMLVDNRIVSVVFSATEQSCVCVFLVTGSACVLV